MAKPIPDQLYMRHRAALKLAVQIGVIEFLHRHKTLAPPVADIAGALRDELAGEAHPLAFLREAFQQKMLVGHLSPTEQLLVMNLVDVFVETIHAYFVERDAVSEQILVRTGEICGWIAEASQIQGSL